MAGTEKPFFRCFFNVSEQRIATFNILFQVPPFYFIPTIISKWSTCPRNKYVKCPFPPHVAKMSTSYKHLFRGQYQKRPRVHNSNNLNTFSRHGPQFFFMYFFFHIQNRRGNYITMK